MNKKIYTLIAFFVLSQLSIAQFQFTHVAEINAGSNNSDPRYFMEYNGELYFNASVSYQQRLYKTSGSGATLVADINGNGLGYVPKPLKVINNKLLFLASSQAHGGELFITDGTASGTEILLDIYPGPNGSSLNYDYLDFYGELNGELYFWAREASGPYSLWKTDGTPTGTVKILDPSFSGGPNSMTTYNGKIYFTAFGAPAENPELYVTDGTAAGTGLFLEINPSTASSLSSGSNPNDLFVYDGYLFFSADDGTNGRELWRSDGTAVGTTMVADIFPNTLNPAYGKGSSPDNFIEFNNELYFSARGYDASLNQITGYELYKYSIANGVNRVKDFYPGNLNDGINSSNPFFILNNELYVAAKDGTAGSNQEIWKTDGTESGTIKVINATTLNNVSPNFSLNDRSFTVLNNKLIFDHNIQQIWVTDGTNAGTQQLTNTGMLNIPTGVYTFKPIVYNNEIYFGGSYPTQGIELWKIADTTLSSEDFTSENKVSLYPNPTKDIINLNTEMVNFTVKVIDITGKELLNVNNQKIINLEKYSSGIYFIQVIDENSSYKETMKILKD